jgi:hypothetical protein
MALKNICSEGYTHVPPARRPVLSSRPADERRGARGRTRGTGLVLRLHVAYGYA